MFKLDHQNDPFVERKIRQILLLYMPFLTQCLNYNSIKVSSQYSMYFRYKKKITNLILIDMIRLKIILNKQNLYQNWQINLFRLLQRQYLAQREPSITKDLSDYLNQFICNDLESKQIQQLCKIIFQLNLNEFIIPIKTSMASNTRDYRMIVAKTIVSKAISMLEAGFDEAKSFVEQTIQDFIVMNIQKRPTKMFEVIKFLLPDSIHKTNVFIIHELCSEINRQLDQLNRNSFENNRGNEILIR